ncbi:MAG: proline--tRNA ligase [Planctomycetes bacterium]|jgi:prolyl-tRNA synthetase|nr:proline--tRNA ligase [Planctomycetota bacterium]HON45803.1 proline--tRNA ligase [Planctomycetota bacterium]HPY75359.1 proline--tRNA ligase [Planctomycetota bacterium]HQB00972.1 proline--tRNA ligase [Planctomycetota bacterium]HRU51145.1 proline--tRNA ligase [Planctomycetota bacterium]
MAEITSQKKDYSRWYTDVIAEAELADYSPVKGSMVIRPYGFAIWEKLQRYLDDKIKETGHQNAYFPLFIPKSFLSKEASHIEGFAKECAIVTHSRLKAETVDDKTSVVVDPNSKLEEELIVRPTSETIINAMFAKWIHSWRDLPLLINQWANVVRWEMRTRLFLRTAEFLWQEGHTAHETEEEAEEETLKMLYVYRDFMQDVLAMPIIVGVKTASERFAGANNTYTTEALMGDGKALQAGTSHNLGQNFAKAFGTQFQDKNGGLSYVWQTSWGVSTRLIGGIIMIHGDDKGIIVPPKVAPICVVIVPIYRTLEEQEAVCNCAYTIRDQIKKQGISVHVDDRDQFKPGNKFYEWEKKGVPLRVEIGPRDLANHKIVLVDRISGKKEIMDQDEFVQNVEQRLEQFQKDLFQKAVDFRTKNSFYLDDYQEMKQQIEETGGFFYLHWCGSEECETNVKEETKATIRCIPLDSKEEQGKCIYCGKPSCRRVIFAKSY